MICMLTAQLLLKGPGVGAAQKLVVIVLRRPLVLPDLIHGVMVAKKGHEVNGLTVVGAHAHVALNALVTEKVLNHGHHALLLKVNLAHLGKKVPLAPANGLERARKAAEKLHLVADVDDSNVQVRQG